MDSPQNIPENNQERIFTIVPIKGMEVVQKNFASLSQDGDLAAREFIKAKKLTLARRFQLIEHGYTLQIKKDGRSTMFDQVNVKMSYDDPIGSREHKNKKNRSPLEPKNAADN